MGFILVVHILACIFLVITILMQAGRGGGLAESFSSAESMFGTQTNSFLVKTSSILAVIFLLTSLVLAVYGSKGERSLMQNRALLPKATQAAPAPAKEEPEVSVKVSAPEPLKADAIGKPLVNAAK